MDKTLEALTKVINILVENYGATGTLLIFIGAIGIAVLWRVYSNYRTDKRIDQLLDEKDKTIQRLAEQERNMRILFLQKVAGWTDKQIEAFVMKNEFKDSVEARKELEQKKDDDVKRQSKSKSKRK
jgi:hypothetical protein